MIEKTVVTTGVPGWAVRIDDGKVEGIPTARRYLERRIPVTLALNIGLVGTTGRMGWADVRKLLAIAKREGTELSIVQHSNTNWTKHATGVAGVNLDFHWNLWTWQDILDELDPSEAARQTGLPVIGYTGVGDNIADVGVGQADFCMRNRHLIADALRTLGMDYAVGLTRFPIGTKGASVGMINSADSWYNNPAAQTWQNSKTLKPGLIVDPYEIPGGFSWDLGTTVVTRGVENGSGAPLPDPNSGAPGWLLGEDNNGAGVEGNKVTNWGRTFQKRATDILGANGWTVIGLHGDARSDASNPSITGVSVSPGHFNSQHVAWILDALRREGHIRLLTYDAWASEVCGDWADGVDVVSNPDFALPLHDIGDLTGGDAFYPRGLVVRSTGNSAFPTGSNCWSPGLLDTDGDQILEDPMTAPQVCGKTVVNGWRGHTGGFLMRPSAATGITSSCYFHFPHLRAGLYRFEVEAKLVSGTLSMTKIGAFGSRIGINPHAWWTGAGYADDYAVAEWGRVLGTDDNYTLSSPPAGEESRLVMMFDLDPRKLRATLMGTVTADPGTVAASGGTYSNTITVAGAHIGAQATVICNEALPADVSLSAVVSAANTVTFTVTNDSGAGWTPGSRVWLAYAEDIDNRQAHPVDHPDAGPWAFHVGMTLTKNTLSQGSLARVRMILLKKYD